MQLIKYKPDFVRKLGDNYKSQLDSNIFNKFLDIKNNFYNDDVSSLSIFKKKEEWRKNNEINEDNTDIGFKKKKDTIKEIYLHLNKLSDSNIETISFQINDLIEKEENGKNNLVEKLVNRLFQNAKIQIQFCHLYAALFSKLIHHNRDLYFEKINQKIKDEFQKLDDMQKIDKEDNYDDYCDNIQMKDNYIGCYQFCVELYSYNVLTMINITQIINNIIQDLEKQSEIYRMEIVVESICRVVKTLNNSKRIKAEDLNQLIDIIKIGYINNKKKLNPRSRFLYEDAINVKV